MWRNADGVTRWTYAQLWERAIEVARALRACGLGKDGRVGVLMTNRPEWLAAVFGTSLAGGVAVTLSTFSTLPELDYLVRASAVSVLLFERTVLTKDFAAILGELEPAIGTSRPGTLESAKYPFLRRLAVLGEPVPGIQAWDEFLASRSFGAPRGGRGDRRRGVAERCRGVVLLVWLHQQAEGRPRRESRGVHSAVAIPADVRVQPRRSRSRLDRQRLFLVRKFHHGARIDVGQRRVARPAIDVRRRGGARAHTGRAGELSVRLAPPVDPIGRRTQLGAGGFEQCEIRRFQDPDRAPSHGFGRVVRTGPCLRQYRNIHDHNRLPGQHRARRACGQLRSGTARRDAQDHRSANRRTSLRAERRARSASRDPH